MNYNIQKIGKDEAVIHSAESLPDNDDFCVGACGRWFNTDNFRVVVKPVTCTRCLAALERNEQIAAAANIQNLEETLKHIKGGGSLDINSPVTKK
jgi:hypothetical protein